MAGFEFTRLHRHASHLVAFRLALSADDTAQAPRTSATTTPIPSQAGLDPQALVGPAIPGRFIGERLEDAVDLVVVARIGEREQFSFEIRQPGSAVRKVHEAGFKFCRLHRDPSHLLAFRLDREGGKTVVAELGKPRVVFDGASWRICVGRCVRGLPGFVLIWSIGASSTRSRKASLRGPETRGVDPNCVSARGGASSLIFSEENGAPLITE
jgi:hypothetical protein